MSEPTYSSAIIRRFEFSSALQRMSVVCKNEIDGKFRAFVKGSPEMIETLCLSGTMPPDFK
jgi:magnesium-transporting ATPase (P-type)